VAHFDLFVVGGGSGGVACARRAGAYGARVGLAEAGRMGGTCVVRGCVPKKLMHYGAHFGELFGTARCYGWQVEPRPALDWDRLIEARNREIARLTRIYERLLEDSGVAVFHGRARVIAPGTVEVATGDEGEEGGGARRTERHTADTILIAVGGRPSRPDMPGAEHAITSDDALETMARRPESIAVVGGGYIGIEQASIYHGLGVPTTLVVRAPLPLRGFDGELREELTDQLRGRGLTIRTHTDVFGIDRADDGRLVLQTSNLPVEADAVLLATGRRPLPNTGDIGLGELGIEMDDDGAILVDAAYRTSMPGIRAVGDCSDHAGRGPDPGAFDLTPIAIAEGRLIADTLFGGKSYELAYDAVPTAVFGLPQLAMVGLPEDAARERGFDVEVFRTSFRPLMYTLTAEERRTTMKLVVDRATDRVLGCHMVGDDAAEIIQGFAAAITAGVTKAQLDATVGLHPTAAEEFVTMYRPARQM
jgi:glutathione reductase (NADPH)